MSQEEIYAWLKDQRVHGHHAFIRCDMMAHHLGKDQRLIRKQVMQLFLAGFLEVDVVPAGLTVARAYRLRDKYVPQEGRENEVGQERKNISMAVPNGKAPSHPIKGGGV